MLHVNLKHKGQPSESFAMGAVPPFGALIVHPKHGALRVNEVEFDIHSKTSEISITVYTLDEEEYKSARGK